MLEEKLSKDWRAKTPEAPSYSLFNTTSQDLGFNHMVDYLEAATEPYAKLRKFASDGTSAEKTFDPEFYKEAVSKFLTPDGPGFDAFDGMHYFRRQDVDNWRALHQAGLLVDPESLPRMGVADVSRKTAAWNKYLEEQQSKVPTALDKGWKTFKEYPDDGKGMKWVEFGEPEYDDISEELAKITPESMSLDELGDVKITKNINPGEGFWAVDQYNGEILGRGDTEDAARRAALTPRAEQKKELLRRERNKVHDEGLREGLEAEGATMGHCVGGYCDDVIGGGTKIYSLRDAKGRPHVTVETAAGDTRDYLRTLPHPDTDNPAKAGMTFNDYVNDMRQGNGDREEYARKLMEKHGIAPPPQSIVQIKGKQNAAPVADYLPYVQDFVKSGKWGRVGDLSNTGLTEFKGGKTNIRDSAIGPAGHEKYPFGERRVFENVEMPKGYMTAEEASQFLQAQGVPADMANNQVGNYEGAFKARARGYARGGSVKPNEPDAPKGFLPRTFEQWVDYAESLYAPATHR